MLWVLLARLGFRRSGDGVSTTGLCEVRYGYRKRSSSDGLFLLRQNKSIDEQESLSYTLTEQRLVVKHPVWGIRVTGRELEMQFASNGRKC